jgi:hypothetical protein
LFWSKIWFFLVTLVAGVAITVALLLPRPTERARAADESDRLRVACGVVRILMTNNAWIRVNVATTFSRDAQLVSKLDEASQATDIDDARSKAMRAIAVPLINNVQGSKPDFAMIIDRTGRVVTRVGVEEDLYGEMAAGRFLIDDALAGYTRDDVWVIGGRLYLMAGAPVMQGEQPFATVGAIILGHAISNQMAKELVKSLDVGIAFFTGNEAVASSHSVPFERERLEAAVAGIGSPDLAGDCRNNTPFTIEAGQERFGSILARLPGEAQKSTPYYSIFVNQQGIAGLGDMIGAVRKEDLSPGTFPWVRVGGGIILVLAIGIVLMILETDRPLRRLNTEAVRMAKGDVDRLHEESHAGTFGSIARSVNIYIDKLSRDAKAAKHDLDQLLGPAPQGGLAAVDLIPASLVAPRPQPSAPSMAPPPSEFKFADTTTRAAPANDLILPPMQAPAPRPPASAAKPPARPAVPGSRPSAADKPLSLDDDILPGRADYEGTADTSMAAGEEHFPQVFDEFVAQKKNCGETIAGLTFAKFADKLRKNRDDLMTKTGCRAVRFTVYVKDGKAALKATPVKDEA